MQRLYGRDVAQAVLRRAELRVADRGVGVQGVVAAPLLQDVVVDVVVGVRGDRAARATTRRSGPGVSLIDLHLCAIAVQLSVAPDGDGGSGRIDYKLETLASPRYDRGAATLWPRRHQAFGPVPDPAPVIAGAIEAAERAGFDAQRVRALDVHRAVINVAAVWL